jgi:hypothetical protein
MVLKQPIDKKKNNNLIQVYLIVQNASQCKKGESKTNEVHMSEFIEVILFVLKQPLKKIISSGERANRFSRHSFFKHLTIITILA